MCIGRGGVVAVTAQRHRSTVANWGRSFFRPSSERTAPFCVAIITATFPESRLSYALMRLFFMPCCVLVRRPAACAVYMAERPRGMTPDAASKREDRGGMHHSRPLYDRPVDLRSQIEAGRPAW